MARVIAVYNQKGGVGKTTTAMNLAAYLAIHGYRTLLIDFDPQFNATVGLGVQHLPDETIYHALLAGKLPAHVIKPTHLANLHLTPSSGDLAGALVELVNLPNREFYLRNFVNGVRAQYDFIFIDLPPSLNLLTVNGLLASDEIIVPVQCEYYSLEGLAQLLQTVDLIRNNAGHPIKVGGALLTMYDKRERLSREIAREVRRRFPHHVYEVEIPRSVSLAEAPSFQKPIALHAPHSSGAEAYEKLAREVAMQFSTSIPEMPSSTIATPQGFVPVTEPAPQEAIVDSLMQSVEEIPIRSAYFEESAEPFMLFSLDEAQENEE
jgi:chromosome partitioning protein